MNQTTSNYTHSDELPEGMLHKPHLLIVDDMPDNLRVLKAILAEQGYEVSAAISGELALKALQKIIPDLVLLDIRMPGMDGYEVCRRIKAAPQTADLPVIFISALNEPDDKVKAFEQGGVDYVTKPFHHQEVLARVATHVQLRQLQQRLKQQNAILEEQVAARTAELNRANESLREANTGLEKALNVKEEFLMMMSHEFRTPLNGILGMATVLKLNGPDEHVDVIENSGWRLLRMVDNLLALSRRGVDPEQVDVESKALDLPQLCRETIQSIATLAARKNIVTELDLPRLPPMEIGMDGARLRQVLGNLLDNAVKFTPEGGKAGLQVRLDEPCSALQLVVWDTGPGISEADQAQLFQPFTQLSSGISRSYQGAGLGLALVRNLLKLHDGTIQVFDGEEGGSRFTVTLPVKVLPSASGEEAGGLSADLCVQLRGLVEAGDVAAVGRFAQALKDSGQCLDVVQRLLDHVERLEIKGIREEIERCCGR